MKILLLTTAMVSLIAVVPLQAQTESGSGSSTDTTTTGTADTGATTDATNDMGATITPPEGYTQFETSALTTEELRGATIYDSNGESVGEISDFVFDSTSSSSDAPSMEGSTTEGAAADTTATTETDADVDADATIGTAETGTADTGEADAATGTDGADVPDASVSTEAGTGADAGQTVDTEGQITHVVLDVGGFLGIGAHTVAVPLNALQVFRDGNNDLRVYLPWTQEQLEALPEFDANDPSTFSMEGDADTSGVANGESATGEATGGTSATEGSTSDGMDAGTGTETDTGTDTGTSTTP